MEIYQKKSAINRQNGRYPSMQESRIHFSVDKDQIQSIYDSEVLRTKVVETEIKLNPSKTIISKMDPNGIIEFANKDFINLCGYEEYEIMGKQHSMVYHSDMPRIILKFIWHKLNRGEQLYAIVKHQSKKGGFYWAVTKYSTKFNDKGEITYHFTEHKAISSDVIKKVNELYATLKKIEDNVSSTVAERYFSGILENKNMNYNEFILDLLKTNSQELLAYFNGDALDENISAKPEKRSLFTFLFKK